MSDFSRASGANFDDDDVARCYQHRAPYSEETISFILELSNGRSRALDLGCGPGKLAAALAALFSEVHAVDPSGPMLDVARTTCKHDNVQWIKATGEAATLKGPYDLIVAGASIHWMDPEIMFPKMAGLLAEGAPFVVVDGDGDVGADWQHATDDFLKRWLPRVGREYDSNFGAAMHAHEDWVHVSGREAFTFEFVQELPDYVECQHSRATWARSIMGETLAAEFDIDLIKVLAPYAIDGMLHYQVRNDVTWGAPRLEPRTRPLRHPQ